MKNEYTPGPWSVRSTEIIASDGKVVALVTLRENEIEEHIQNAYLIAAATDLLAALEMVVSANEEMADCDDAGFLDEGPTMTSVRAAISKAKGVA